MSSVVRLESVQTWWHNACVTIAVAALLTDPPVGGGIIQLPDSIPHVIILHLVGYDHKIAVLHTIAILPGIVPRHGRRHKFVASVIRGVVLITLRTCICEKGELVWQIF